MDFIDEKGRLFGYVNLVDALVVLLVLAVLLAGAAFVLQTEERASRYATIELGQQPEYIADTVTPGDVGSYTGTNDNLTVTDVYVTPSEGGGFFIEVRAELHGRLVESEQYRQKVFSFNGNTLQTGDELTINTPRYTLTGIVRETSTDNPELQLETTTATVEIRNTDPDVADALRRGLTENVAGRDLARITNVTVEPSEIVVQSDQGRIYLRQHPRNKDITMELELLTRQTDGAHWFHGKRLRANTGVTLDFDTVTVTGRVTEVR